MKKARAHAKYLWHSCITAPASLIRNVVGALFWGAVDTFNAFLPYISALWWLALIPISFIIIFIYPDVAVLVLKVIGAFIAFLWNDAFKPFVEVMRKTFPDTPAIVNFTTELISLFIADFFDRSEGWFDTMLQLLLTTFDFFVASFEFYVELIVVTINQILAGGRDFMCDAGFLSAASCADIPSFYTPVTEYIVGNVLFTVYAIFDAFWFVADFVITIIFPYILMTLMWFGGLVALTVQMFLVFFTFGTELFLNLLLYLFGLIWGTTDYHGELPTNSTSRPFNEYIKDKYQNFDMSAILDVDPAQLLNNTRLDYVPGMPAYRETLINVLYEIRNVEKVINENFAQILAFGDHKLCCALNLNTCGRYLYVCDLIFAKDGPLWYTLYPAISTGVLSQNVFFVLVYSLMVTEGVDPNVLGTADAVLSSFMSFLMTQCKLLGSSAGNCICNAYVASRSRPEDAPLFTWGNAGQTTNFPDAFGSLTAIERVPCWLPGGFCLIASDTIRIWDSSQCTTSIGSTYTSIQAPFLGVFLNLTAMLSNKPSVCTFFGSILQPASNPIPRELVFYDADRDSWPWNNTFPMMVFDLYTYRRQFFLSRIDISGMSNQWIGPGINGSLTSVTLDTTAHDAKIGIWSTGREVNGGTGEVQSITVLNQNLGYYMQNRLSRNYAFRAYGGDDSIYWNDYDVLGTNGMTHKEETERSISFIYTENLRPNDGLLTSSLLTGICFGPFDARSHPIETTGEIPNQSGMQRQPFQSGFFIRADTSYDKCNIVNAPYAPPIQEDCNNKEVPYEIEWVQNPTAVCPISRQILNGMTNEEAMCLISGTWINEARNVYLRGQLAEVLLFNPISDDWKVPIEPTTTYATIIPPWQNMPVESYTDLINAMYHYWDGLPYVADIYGDAYQNIRRVCTNNNLLRGKSTTDAVNNCIRIWTAFQSSIYNIVFNSPNIRLTHEIRIVSGLYNGNILKFATGFTHADWKWLLINQLTRMLNDWNNFGGNGISALYGQGGLNAGDYQNWITVDQLPQDIVMSSTPQWLTADPRMIYDHLINGKVSELCALGISGITSNANCIAVWSYVANNLPHVGRIYVNDPFQPTPRLKFFNVNFVKRDFSTWWFPTSVLNQHLKDAFGSRYNMPKMLYNQYRWAQSAYQKRIPLSFLNPLQTSTEDSFTATILNYFSYAVMRQIEDDSAWLVGHPIFSSTDELTSGFLMSELALPSSDYQFSRNFPCTPKNVTNQNPFFNYTMELMPHLQVVETVRYHVMKEMLKKFWARIYPANCQLVQSFIVDCNSSKFWQSANWDTFNTALFRWNKRSSINNEKYGTGVTRVPLAELVTRQLVKEYTGDGSAAGSFRYAANRIATYAFNTTAEYVAATMSILNTTKTLYDIYANITWSADVNVPAGTPATNAQALCIARLQPKHLCVSYTTPSMMAMMMNPLRYSERTIMDAWFDTNYNFGNGPMVKSKVGGLFAR